MLVGWGSKNTYVGPFPLNLSQVFDLFTKQRIFLKIIGEQKPPHFPTHQLIMSMLLASINDKSTMQNNPGFKFAHTVKILDYQLC